MARGGDRDRGLSRRNPHVVQANDFAGRRLTSVAGVIAARIDDNRRMPVPDGNVLLFWQGWFMKWRRRISCMVPPTPPRATPRRHRHKEMRPIDVFAAWVRLFMPATEAEYVVPDWWLALSAEEKRRLPRPKLTVRLRRVRPASEAAPGFSMDDVGRYLKLADGTILRDRRSAAHRLWRQPGLAPNFVDPLFRRMGRGGRPVKGRTSERVLEAVVCRSLVAAGMTQIGAATAVLAWSGKPEKDPKKLADENRTIWRELHVPPVSE